MTSGLYEIGFITQVNLTKWFVSIGYWIHTCYFDFILQNVGMIDTAQNLLEW